MKIELKENVVYESFGSKKDMMQKILNMILDSKTDKIIYKGNPSDINYNNIVNSEKIADFHVVYRHKGPENNITNPGWLGRLLNGASPY